MMISHPSSRLITYPLIFVGLTFRHSVSFKRPSRASTGPAPRNSTIFQPQTLIRNQSHAFCSHRRTVSSSYKTLIPTTNESQTSTITYLIMIHTHSHTPYKLIYLTFNHVERFTR